MGAVLTCALHIPIAQADLFAPGVNYVGGLYPGAIAVGDFNGDGKLDAAVIDMSSGNVSIFLGQGNGTMQLAPIALPTGIYASRVVVADFNNDGKSDLAVTNIGSNNVGIYLGNGDGTFRAPTYVAAGLAPSGIAVADLNGDGKQDLVVTNASSGTIVGQSVTVLPGNGDGTFGIARTYTSGVNPQDIVIGDFNGDGKPDLAVANNSDATISILLGNGDGTFGPGATFATGFRPYMLRAFDVNGDGRLDLAVVTAFGISIMLGRNDGTFPTVSNIALSFTPNGLAIGDFNGDGLLDLATGNIFGSNLVVLLGNGSGAFQAPISFGTGSGPMAVESVSLRGDGVLDLLVANRTSNNVTVLLNTSVANPPALLLVRDGTPQGTQVGNAFPVALSATVRDAGGRALPGALVTFTAPQGGATGSFAGGQSSARVISDALGVATAPTLTSNLTAGTYNVVATVGALSTSFALSNVGGSVSPSFTSGSPPGGQVGVAYSFTIRAAGLPAPTYAVTAGGLPAGNTLNATTGSIGGTPTAVGSYSGVITASNGVSPAATQSFVIAVAQAGQTITFGPISSRTLGASPFAVAASASSGLAVALASLTNSVCSLSGNTVTLIAAGTCTVRASQPGNATYAAAPNVDQSFTVTGSLVSQVITFAALSSRSLGGAPFDVSATASSGLAVTFSSLSGGVCTVAASAVTLLAAGTCTIRASQAGNASYAPAANVDQSFTVTAQASQTINFAPLGNLPYGAPPFAVNAAASSGLPVNVKSLTTSVCMVNATTVTVIALGTCTLRASQAGNASFQAAVDVERAFAVTAAAQNINFSAIGSRFLDVPPFELLALSTSGLPVSFVSLSPAVCRMNDQWLTILTVGTCTIRASQAGNGNYTAAPNVDQSFAVTPAFQTLLFPQPTAQSLLHPQFQPQATASSGLAVTFSSLTPTVCTSSGNGVTLVAVGTCTLRATQSGNDNYAAVSIDRSFPVMGTAAAVPSVATPGPIIVYSTLLGGFAANGYGRDKVFDVVVAPDGSAYVGGSVADSYFPGIGSASFTNSGMDLMYVAKMNPNRGQIDVATVVGARTASVTGSGAMAYVGADQVEAMAISTSGVVYAAAYASSVEYPITGGTFVRAGAKSIFRVGSDGSTQALPAVIDPAVKTIRALAVDSSGAIYLTGVANPGLATSVGAAVSAASAVAGGPYLIKLAPGGTGVAYATYLSIVGSRSSVAPDPQRSLIDNATTGYALAVDDGGNAYVAGQATANDFPVTAGAPDTVDSQNRDAFVAKVNAGGTALLWVARMGGPDAERATSIALAPDGTVVIGGKSATLPRSGFMGTTGAFQQDFNYRMQLVDRERGFVAKLASDGSRWLFVAPIGSAAGNLVRGASASSDPAPIKIAVDATGAIYVTGFTDTDRQLPVAAMDVRPQTYRNLQPIQSPGYFDDGSTTATYGASAVFYGRGAFLMKLTSDGTFLTYSVIVNSGVATGLALDAFGAAYVTGYRAGLPQINATESAPGSIFIAKIVSQTSPVVVKVLPSPSNAGQAVMLSAQVGDARYPGSIQFRDGTQLLATVPVVNGTASIPAALALGVHRINATFVGAGPSNGAVAPEVVHVVNQAGGTP